MREKMKKAVLISCLLTISGSVAANDIAFYGEHKGSITDYYPNIKISDVMVFSQNTYYSVVRSIQERASKNETLMLSTAIEYGKKNCKNSKGFFLDHFDVTHQMLNTERVVFSNLSTNVVCIKE
uniref:Uncharacterized protein n=2 Tax=Vibrio splendidus TaxID=29497 RepID=A0A0H3ZX86_VIBSP|nr:hypothetical protein [Vibrio splendidus]